VSAVSSVTDRERWGHLVRVTRSDPFARPDLGARAFVAAWLLWQGDTRPLAAADVQRLGARQAGVVLGSPRREPRTIEGRALPAAGAEE
jgi:hypothetical protein